jgi:hypothetical protein
MQFMKKGACSLVAGLLFMGPMWSQQMHSIPLHHVVGPAHELPADPALVVQSLEAPDAFSTQAGLNEIKLRLFQKEQPSSGFQDQRNPASGPIGGTGSGDQTQKTMADSPRVVFGKKTFRVFGTVGVVTDLLGGTPNDNTLAVNNSGHVLIGVNSYLWGWDQNTDTLLFPQSYIPLSVLGQLSGSDYAFDPKLAYDPEADRFVLVFLINNTPANNRIAVCFSKTNDPRDGWNVYTLSGNPLNNNRWSDFPAIAITKDKVVLSLNLIVPNVSWQVGFDGSVLWEMDKDAGYSGTATLPTLLHHDFKFNGRYTRNLLPLTGWNGVADRPVLMSNRNFSPLNDSVFVWTPAANPTANNGFECRWVSANPVYGLPPNGRQSTTPANDPTKGLQTNDGRWLGGLVAPDGAYHVVSTTRTFSAPSERAGIYYGILPLGSDTLSGRILSDPIKDFGYPNIVFTGNEACDEEYVVGFNHTSPSHHPGNSLVYVGNDGSFSPVVQLKAGLGPVSKLGGAERWGDYFGLQRVYGTTGGEPNLREQKVWAAGFFGSGNGGNSTWISAVTTPDSSQLEGVWEMFGSGCDWSVSGVAQGGSAPYRWITSKHTDTLEGPGASWSGLCSGDSLQVWVLDARGCVSTVEFKFPFSQAPTPSAFPNPISHSHGNRVVLAVSLPSAGLVALDCIDATGRVVHIGERQARAGRNELSFDPQYLKPGWYQVRIRSRAGETFAPLLVIP